MDSCVYCHFRFVADSQTCPKCLAPNPKFFIRRNTYPYSALKRSSNTKTFSKKIAFVILFLLVLLAVASQRFIGSAHVSSVKPKQKSQVQLASIVHVDKGLIPIFVGKNAASAFSVAESLNYLVTLSPLDESSNSIEPSSSQAENSYVCYQSRLAGEKFEEYVAITLVVDPSCLTTAPTMLAGKYAIKAGLWHPTHSDQANYLDNKFLEGWVVRLGDEYSPERVTVLTQYGEQTFNLSLIQPTSSWCEADTFAEHFAADALSIRDEMLPFAEPVRVVLAEGQGSSEAFIHRLDTEGKIVGEAPPSGSVNQLLVASGYWVPDEITIDETDILASPKSRTWKVESFFIQSQLQAKYARNLANTANTVRKNAKLPAALCVKKEQADWNAWN